MSNNTYKLRMLTAAAERYKIGLPLLILMCGTTLGFFMVTFFLFLPNTFATFFTVAMIVPLIIVIMGDTKRFLMAILVICLPITVTMTLNATEHISGAAGYMVSVFDVALGALYLIWLIDILRKKSMKVNFFPKISIPAFFLILMGAVSMAFARFPDLSRFELIEVVKMYFCFLYLANNIKNKRDVQLVVLFLLLGLALEGVLGFLQHRYGDPYWPTTLGGTKKIQGSRIYGTWRSYNDFAWYLGLVMPLSFSILFSKIKPIYKFLCGLIFFLSAGSLMWTNSRGGWISFGAGALFVSICVFSKIKGKTGLIKTFGWIMIVAIFISPLYPRLSEKFFVRFGGEDRGSAESRLPQFKVAYSIIKDNPLVGVGINNYTEVMDDYDTTPEGIRTYTPHAVHNIFLHIGAEMGVFGLIAFMLLICAIFVEGMKHILSNDDFAAYAVIGMLGGIIAFLVHGLADTANIGGKLYMFVWFFTGMIYGIRKVEWRKLR
jgi:putative inorganic carbon (HCO3(-)) transporter